MHKESRLSLKPALAPVLVPGLLSGFIIWAAQFAGDQILIATGFVQFRSILFPIMLLLATPVLLAAAGALSERTWNREQGTRWTLLIPCLAGFLGMGCAVFLFRTVSAFNQYVPAMLPGILPRLSYVASSLVFHLPEGLVVSACFAVFALAGGWYAHRLRVRRG
jgi:hypothetical protein